MAIVQLVVAGESYDSYTSLADAERWIQIARTAQKTSPSTDYSRWAAQTDDVKNARLVRTSRQLDTLLWNESADTRAKRAEIPAIADATAQMAGEDWKLDDSNSPHLLSLSNGGMNFTFPVDPSKHVPDVQWTAQAHGISPTAYQILAPYLRSVKDSGTAIPMSFD